MKLNNASLVIEGEVIDRTTFTGRDGEIYTNNVVETYSVVQGQIATPLVNVITMGGRTETQQITWSHLPSFSLGDRGIFFLQTSDRPCFDERNDCMTLYSGSQGFYQLQQTGSTGSLVSAVERYEDYRDFYRKIGLKFSGFGLTTVTDDDDACLVFKVVYQANSSFTQNSTALNVNLYVKLNEGFKHLYRSRFVVGYSGDFFGANIVASGNLSYTDGELATDSYELTVEDKSDYELKIDLEGQTTDPDELEQVGEEYRQITSMTIYMQGWSNDLPIVWNPADNDNNYYIEADTELQKAFDCAEIEFQENTGINPVINEVFPTTVAAGVGVFSENMSPINGVIFIDGTGFTEPPPGEIKPANMYVEFNTVANGKIRPFEGDYLLWSNEQIQVKVPSLGLETQSSDPFSPTIIDNLNTDNACTGKIRICVDGMMACGTSVESAEVLNIRYSVQNNVHELSTGVQRSVPAVLLNWIDGGYLIQNHPNIQNHQEAKSAFIRALNKWRCTTGFNANYPDELISGSGEGLCFIRFSNLPFGTQSTVRASTFAETELCENDNSFGSLDAFTIQFNEDIEWHYGINTPVIDWFDNSGGNLIIRADFESTALHELGHTHLLLHTCNLPSTNLMYSPGPNDYRRTINQNAELGGHHIMNLSESITAASCLQDGIERILPQDCLINNVSDFKPVEGITIYPNPARSKIFIEGMEALPSLSQLGIYNVLGKQVRLYNNPTMSNGLDVETLPPGVYILTARGDANYYLGQLVIQ